MVYLVCWCVCWLLLCVVVVSLCVGVFGSWCRVVGHVVLVLLETLVGLVAVGGSLVCVVAEGPSLNVLWLRASSSSIFAA